jgi:hypothetical protein
MISELYQQTYTYDTGNNLTRLLHQANSSTWQQTLTIRLSKIWTRVLGVVFATFAQNMGTDVQSVDLFLCFVD